MDVQFSESQKTNTFMENLEVIDKVILLWHLFSYVTGQTVPNSYFLYFVHINQIFIIFFCSNSNLGNDTTIIIGKQGRIYTII